MAFFFRTLMVFSGLAAVAALVLEYGFHKAPVAPRLLHAVQTAVVLVFVFDRVFWLATSPRRTEYLRSNLIDFILMGIALGVFAMGLEIQVLSAGALYVIITQVYMLVALLLRGVNFNLRFAGSGIHPSWLLIVSFLFLCLAGSGLLMLPVAVHEQFHDKWYYPDALFTAVSATCVTGLVVNDTGAHFTFFGQAVIVAMIQLGGLGIMLFGTMLALLVGGGLSVRSAGAIGHMLATERPGELARTLKFVALVTLAVELAGAALMYPMFASSPDDFGRAMSQAGAIWYSVFHSVSSFCNAGFSLYGQNMMQGVGEGWNRPLRDNWQIMGVMAPLIVIGGLGFSVLQDCARWFHSRLRRMLCAALPGSSSPAMPKARLTLHSKIVLVASALLIVLGAGVLILIEKLPGERAPSVGRSEIETRVRDRSDKTALCNLQSAKLVEAAVFQSVSARTAGFNTVDMDKLSHSGKFWMCGLMVIGGSPGGTAGGMKTATFAMLVAAIYCVLRRRSELEVFHRSISTELLQRTVAVAVLYLALVATTSMLLSVSMKEYNLTDLVFEACSACGTVGLSTGITPKLTLFPKYVVIAGMFIGRIGPLTLMLALTSKRKYVRYAYPTENVVIG
jgi:trk system potassium uptake protein TrkH